MCPHTESTARSDDAARVGTTSSAVAPLSREQPWRTPLDALDDQDWGTLVKYLKLSRREEQIARCALRNDKMVTIAAHLGVSPHTVHTYRERLFRKLGIGGAAELVAVLFVAYIDLTKRCEDRGQV